MFTTAHRVLVSLVQLVAATALACGSELGYSRLEMGGWSFNPVITEKSVGAIVMVRDPGQLPKGITGLLGVCEADGSWSLRAWVGASVESIALHLGGMTGQEGEEILDRLDDRTDSGRFDGVEAVAPVPLGSGVPAGHPLEILVESASDPIAMLRTFEQLGYPAVSAVVMGVPSVAGHPPVEHIPGSKVQCDIRLPMDQWLSILKRSFEADLGDEPDGFFVMTELLDAL